jgi:hypothetical protein
MKTNLTLATVYPYRRHAALIVRQVLGVIPIIGIPPAAEGTGWAPPTD